MPIEPPPTPWEFPDPATLPDDDLVGVGADLAPGTLLAAYRRGFFPMPVDPTAPELGIAWFSPLDRGVLPLDRLRVSRSLGRSARRFEIRVDTAFDDVVARCADPSRPHRWISDEIRTAYAALHALGWAHSVESWLDGRLVGGLYGVAIGGLFAGESMFHTETDASKVALVGLVERLRAAPGGPQGRLLDVQWQTPHLASLGVVAVPREEYLERLARALPLPAAFTVG